jgi:hypothetical protein
MGGFADVPDRSIATQAEGKLIREVLRAPWVGDDEPAQERQLGNREVSAEQMSAPDAIEGPIESPPPARRRSASPGPHAGGKREVLSDEVSSGKQVHEAGAPLTMTMNVHDWAATGDRLAELATRGPLARHSP